MIEKIAIDIFPCWERQSSEPEEKFILFQGYFLPLPRANLTESYRRYRREMVGECSIEDAPKAWRDDCDRYQWRSRHTAFWRDHHQKNLDWIESERQKLVSLELATAQIMMQKAIEILDLPIDADRVGPKDAATLARAGSELGRLALGLDNIDKAIDTLIKSGFSVGLGSEIKGMLADEKISALLESGRNGKPEPSHPDSN